MDLIVECGAVPALVKHLQTPTTMKKGDPKPFEYEVEKSSAFALGLLAVKVILKIFVCRYQFNFTVDFFSYTNTGRQISLFSC